ncbi:unnamed protein product [Ixodes pacificus]
MDCIKCVLPLPGDGKFLTCVLCRNGYHLSKSCSGVAEATFSGMGATRRENWKCATCRTGELRSGTGTVADVSHALVTGQLASISQTLNQLLSLKTSVDTLLPLPSKVEELLALRPIVEELRSTVEVLQTTVDSFGARYDSVLALAVTNEESIKTMQAEVDTVKVTLEEQSLEISRMKNELNDSEQYSRRSNMELHGLPFTPGEDLRKVMEDLSQKLSLPIIRSSDVLAIHRLPKRRDLAPTVLIKFATIELKNVWMSARARLQALHHDGSQQKLFFNENLTQTNRELFWMARTKGKESGYRFVWLKNGKIFARKGEGCPALRIGTANDLQKLI